ncbi:glutamine--fructose-6-phosphate transaminase (isomerizing) [Candidatus Ichthyocystis sparus]|uniref:glutamine--fructose-6-phosphate transaminase (isomerizing) n=1 Tax=Candidatus Ichthyocystis sparus TaxID=1561004 RepID=UPI000B17F72C|nr:glutamine--fructose-6-phosphate transaminase (isomerizing) [Candidatus Ichthyocystis sparus]
MCGIVAALSRENVVPAIIKSLEALEYRGYDSAGIAVTTPQTHRIRTVGRISELKKKTEEQGLFGTTGIGHTRWATHGQLNERNVHPLLFENIVLAHNGIVENVRELLVKFPNTEPLSSETDSEVLASIIVWWKKNKGLSTLDAIINTTRLIEGSFALAVIDTEFPREIYITKYSSPIVVAKTIWGILASSDPLGIAHLSTNFSELQDYDIAHCSPNGIHIIDKNKITVKRHERKIIFPSNHFQLNSKYNTFMEKETYEQPQVLSNIIDRFIDNDGVSPNDELTKEFWQSLNDIQNVYIIGCGSSYHAAVLAKNWLEDIAEIHTEVDIASQFKGYPCQILDNSLVIFISQSGETADTLAALSRMPTTKKALTLALCNAENSTLARKTDFFWNIRAGIEISVASTKTFSSQLLCLLILAISLKSKKPCASKDEIVNLCNMVRTIPSSMKEVLSMNENVFVNYAKQFSQQQNIIFLGKNEDYSLALEAALKIKELAYIHAEGYSSGEFKHGPLAMVDDKLLVVFIITNSNVFSQVRAHHSQVTTRKGETLIMAVGDGLSVDGKGIFINNINRLCRPFCMSIIIQQLARFTAQARRLEIDKPRNLAKSVTVE